MTAGPLVPAAADAAALAADSVTDPDTAGWRRPPVTADQRRADLFMAAGLLVGATLSLVLWQMTGLHEEPAPAGVSLVCLAAVTVPLAVRRRWPSAVAGIVTVAFIVTSELYVPETLVINIALFVALYTVGAWDPDRRRAVWVRTAVIVAMFAWLLISIFRTVTDPDSLPDISRAGAFSPLLAYMLIQLLTNVLYFAGAVYFGDHAWAAARQRARTAWRGRQLQAERQRVEEQAVAIERLRLARELHDAVAHHVSMMGVQAAAARTVLDADPARAATALEHVEDSAREAITELHGMLGMLRETAELATPREAGVTDPAMVGSLSVEQIPALVARSREAEVPAEFQVVGSPVRLPPLVSLNLYRIAQEALTNTRKHGGPGARADVRLRYLDDAVELEVADDGSRAGRARLGADQAPSGLGLVGMRERVAADGGTLEAGPRTRGGYLVRARVPLTTMRGATHE